MNAKEAKQLLELDIATAMHEYIRNTGTLISTLRVDTRIKILDSGTPSYVFKGFDIEFTLVSKEIE